MRVLIVAAFAAFVVACGAVTPVADVAQQADVAAYAAEESACVSSAVSADAGLAGANACIASVKSRWCGDGGQLAGYCVGQDGGSK
jgi:hypothetical protein